VVYLLDWFAPHLDPKVDEMVHSAGHAVLRIGGHLAGLVQVEDTHCNAAMAAAYRRRETQEAHEQLRVRPDQLPSTSRQTVLERALVSWLAVDHVASSQGFVANGIANALGGSQDDILTLDVVDLWHEVGMPGRRTQIEKEVAEALSQGVVTSFAEYTKLLAPYDAHAPFSEGQEAFGARIVDDGEAGAASSGSETPPDGEFLDYSADEDEGAPAPEPRDEPPASPEDEAAQSAALYEPPLDLEPSAGLESSAVAPGVEHRLSERAARDLGVRADARSAPRRQLWTPRWLQAGTSNWKSTCGTACAS